GDRRLDQTAGVEGRQAALRRERGDRDEHADQKVRDADAQQRLERIAQLHLSLMQQRTVCAPGEHRASHEDDPSHTVPRLSQLSAVSYQLSLSVISVRFYRIRDASMTTCLMRSRFQVYVTCTRPSRDWTIAGY